jgi:hypothetical protein
VFPVDPPAGPVVFEVISMLLVHAPSMAGRAGGGKRSQPPTTEVIRQGKHGRENE